MNGQACLDTMADVRDRRKEFGESEVEFSHITGTALSLFGQLFKSTMLEKSPFSFLISQILLPPLLQHFLIPPQPEVLWHILILRWDIHLPCGCLSRRLNIACSYVGDPILLV